MGYFNPINEMYWNNFLKPIFGNKKNYYRYKYEFEKKWFNVWLIETMRPRFF